MEYQPAPGSPSADANQDDDKKSDSDSDEEDPLDAFMAGINQEVARQKTKSDKDDKKERDKKK